MRIMLLAAISLAVLGAQARAAESDIHKLAWLSGCWQSDTGEPGSGEQWSALAGGTMLGAGRTVRQGKTVDFEFMQLIVTYSTAGGPLPAIVCTILLYDSVKQTLSNIAALDVFYNGAPLSSYVNGAMVPPLLYPGLGRQSQIRADLTPLIGAGLLPLTVNLHFVGANRIPC